MEIKRRDFIKLLGGVTGAIAVGGFGLDQIIDVPEAVLEQAKNGPGLETWKSTMCGQCPGGCGVRVRLIDDIPVYLKGNPVYPVNQGGMCPLGHSAIEVLFNPDRIRGPLQRIGPPGSGKWEPTSWEDALTRVADTLAELRNGSGPHQVAFLGSDEQGLMKEHIARFMQAYGSPNYFQFAPTQHDSVPFMLVQGHARIPAYDLLNAKLVLSFGANYLEEGYAPVYYTKMYSRLRSLVDGGRVRFIQVDSRLGLTAANADRWVPVRPGTYGALALGIAHVLIREELYDRGFVETHTFGFEDWTERSGQTHLGFQSVVLDDYYPERVSEITGVPSEAILDLARELGNTRPALVLGNQGAVDNTNGTYAQMAVHSLNALLGNFEREGGVFLVDEPPFASLPAIQVDPPAQQGNERTSVARSQDTAFPFAAFSIDSFTDIVLADRPYPIRLLFLYGGNPLFQTLNRHDFAEALRRIPLVVSFDPFINETNEYADLILPDHTFLEKWDAISGTPTVGFTHVGIQQPVVEPLYDTRHAGDVLIDLARRVGGSVAASFPLETYQETIHYRMRGVYESGEGAVASEGVRQSWLDYLQQRGWHIGQYASFEEFWRLLLENGGWWNPIRKTKDWNEIFQTPSGKYEFYAQTLNATIDSLVEKQGDTDPDQALDRVLNRLGVIARGDRVFLPHHEPVPYEDQDGPLYLTTFQLLTNRDGRGANQPMMQEMFGYTMRQYWRSWVEIHPETASAYGIIDGAWVWVQSALGSLRVRAKVHPGIMPGVVGIPFGLGHTSYGRYAEGHGVNPNAIMKNLYDVLSGKPALQATRVTLSVTA